MTELEQELFQAIQDGSNIARINELLDLKEINLKVRDVYGQNLLNYATEKGLLEIVNRLLNLDCDVARQDKGGNTPLHLAARNGHENIIQLLIDFMKTKEIDLELKDIYGQTALHIAVMKKNLNIVEQLLNAGCDVNPQDESGRTPLHLAVKNAHTEMVELLLQTMQKKEIDPNLQDEYGHTALHVIVMLKGNLAVNMTITEQLLNAGCNVNVQNKSDRTPLDLAAAYGYKNMVELFLQIEGVNPNLQDKLGRTALHTAVLSKHFDIVEQLLNAGCDVTIQDREGNSPLQLAIIGGHLDVVKQLASCNLLNINIQDNGETPLSWATRTHKESLVPHPLQVMETKKIDPNLKSNETEKEMDVMDAPKQFLISSESQGHQAQNSIPSNVQEENELNNDLRPKFSQTI